MVSSSHYDTSNDIGLVVAMRPYIDQGWEFCGICTRPWGFEGADHWFLLSYNPSKLLDASNNANMLLLFFMQSPFTSHVVWAIQWKMEMPLEFDYNNTCNVPPAKYGNPLAHNWHAQQYIKDLWGYPTNLTAKHITRVASEF